MSADSTMPEPGSVAPDFSGPTQDGSVVSMADYAGKKLAIYFYPKDNTPGCTKQACNLRDNFSILSEKGVSIVGVSGDAVEKHAGFADKYQLTFPLIADTEKAMMTSYGTYGKKNLYGKIFMGIKRTTFLVDEEGIIVKVIKKPKTTDHAAEILKGFNL